MAAYFRSRDVIPQGTLHLLILKTLARGGEMHGFEIAEAIERESDQVLTVEEGSLYPALHRMEQAGWIAAEWQVTANNRRARLYRITKAGQKHLDQEQEKWDRLTKAVGNLQRTAAALNQTLKAK